MDDDVRRRLDRLTVLVGLNAVASVVLLASADPVQTLGLLVVVAATWLWTGRVGDRVRRLRS